MEIHAFRRARSRRAAVDQAKTPSSPVPDPLVDADLSPEEQKARDAAMVSLIRPEGRRVCAAFLGRDDYEKVEDAVSLLMAELLLGALPSFVKAEGGKIVWSIRASEQGEIINAIQKVIEINGRTFRILQDGYLFLCIGNERVVVSTERVKGFVMTNTAICVRSNVDTVSFVRRWKEHAKENNHLSRQAFFADGELVKRNRTYGWDDILLPESTKQMIRNHVEGFLENRDRLKSLGVKARRGLILTGPPGTGKTLLGKVLADTLGFSFMWVSPRHIENPESFKEILSVARFVAPSVIFLEDLDLFAGERESGGGMGLGELMNQLDGATDNEDIVTIATTNRLDVVEKALRNRPGRFDRVVEFGSMDEFCRIQMLRRLLEKAEVLPADMDRLVAETTDYTGAQLEELANTLYILAVSRDNAVVQGSTSKKDQVWVDQGLIESALQEMKVEKKGLLGFHAA